MVASKSNTIAPTTCESFKVKPHALANPMDDVEIDWLAAARTARVARPAFTSANASFSFDDTAPRSTPAVPSAI